MINFFNIEKLNFLSNSLSEIYRNNFPYPHCVIDDFLDNLRKLRNQGRLSTNIEF